MREGRGSAVRAIGGLLFVAAALVASPVRALTNSEVDEGHPAIVTFKAQGFIFCTGTVIAPRVILTAGHCVDFEVTGVTPTEIEVFFGTDPVDNEDEGVLIPVVEGLYAPGYDIDDLYSGSDVGLLRLAEDAPAEPMPMGSPPEVGAEVTLVGFGITSPDGTGGVKRIGAATISELDEALFDLAEEPSALCVGDSGGPALIEVDGVETIVGVGSLGSCGGLSVEQRVDLHLEDFILPFTATCEGDGLCAAGCPSPDPDCPCAADELCTAACAEPGADPDCPACSADGVCDAACPGAPDPDCTAGTTSSSAAGGGGGGEGGAGDAPSGEDEESDDGCAVGGPASISRPDVALLLLATALATSLRRMRRRGRQS